MMQRDSAVAGVGGILFPVLWFLAAFVPNAPGGTYDASSVADFVAKDHRTSVFIALFLGLLSVLGLLLLLVGLRERVAGGDSFLASVFSTTGLVSVTAFAIGWVTVYSVPVAIAYGGSNEVVIDPKLTYVLAQAGWVIMFGVGGTFLGLTLIALMLGSRQTLPAWLRWFTLIAGVLGLASMAWIPHFALLLWSLVAGVWLIAAGRAEAPAGQPQRSS